MVMKFADHFYFGNVMDYFLRYEYKQHQSDSEESLSGLGFEKKNSKTWFSHVSDRPKYDSKGMYDDNLLFVLTISLDPDV